MLETVREYARERLELSDEPADLRRRHAEFYARLGKAARPRLRGPGREWLDRVEVEHDNFRAALDWTLQGGDLALGFEIAESLLVFWHVRARHPEGRRWLEKALAQAEKLRREALRLCWDLRDPRGVARTLHYIAEEAHDSGDLDGARRAFEESMDVMGALGDKSFVVASLHGLGDLELDAGNAAAARDRYREGLSLSSDLEIPRFVMYSIAGLAAAAPAAGDLRRAGRLWGAAESHEERLGLRILSFERERYERALDRYAADPAFAAAVAEGRKLSQADAAREALSPD